MPGSVLKKIARKVIFDNTPRVFLTGLLYALFTSVVSWLAFRLTGLIGLDEVNLRLASGELPGFEIFFSDFRITGIILAALVFMLQPLLDAGFISYCLKLKREQKTDFFDLFNGFIFFFKVIKIFLITFIYVFLWSILLIIPGIVASYRYRQAYYILVDDPGKSALQCISESCLMMKGKKLDLFIIDISFLGWFALNMLVVILIPIPFAIPVVTTWLYPYLGLTRVVFYDEVVSNVAV